jgi:DNA primase
MEAKPFLEFRLERVLASANVRSPEGRARAAEAAVAVVAEHPNEHVRDQYLGRVADVCRVDRDRLRDLAAKGARRPQPDQWRKLVAPGSTRSSGPEIEALRLAVHRPADVAARLEGVLFADDVHLDAFEALCGADTLSDAIAGARPEAASLLQRIAVEDAPEVEADDVVRRLAHAAGMRALGELRAESRAKDGPVEIARAIDWLKLTTERLLDATTGTDAAEQLVAWLVQLRTEGE